MLPGPSARALLGLPVNPNGRPNSDVIVPFLVGDDVTSRPLDRFIVDFREMPENQAALYEKPFAYIQPVKAHRAAMVQPEALEKWWQYWRSRPEMRAALAPLKRFIATPRIAKHRLFAWFTRPRLPDNAVVVIARDDDTSFGILQSRFHAIWSLRKGTALEDRPRYTSRTTFETFPFPEGLSPNLPAQSYFSDPRAVTIAETARRLDNFRNNWLNPSDLVDIVPEMVAGYPDRVLPKNDEATAALKKRTLTKLYNERPQWLIDAHNDLDAAVAAAYDWPGNIAEDDVLSKLLELNQRRPAALGVEPPIDDTDSDAIESE